MIVSWVEQAVTRMDTRVMNLEYSVAMLTGRLEAVEKQAAAEPPEPPPDLEATIRSLHESNVDLRGQLADAKQTERDLDAEVARLTKENQRLTQLAWQAEQDKQAADALVRTYLGQLKAVEDNVERARQERDLALKQRDDLARDAGALIGARALNEALTQKQHMLEAKNRDLEERLERHRDCIDRTADALELLGFQVFAPGTDICDNG
jgi:chromosome segregation ATPase